MFSICHFFFLHFCLEGKSNPCYFILTRGKSPGLTLIHFFTSPLLGRKLGDSDANINRMNLVSVIGIYQVIYVNGASLRSNARWYFLHFSPYLADLPVLVCSAICWTTVLPSSMTNFYIICVTFLLIWYIIHKFKSFSMMTFICTHLGEEHHLILFLVPLRRTWFGQK